MNMNIAILATEVCKDSPSWQDILLSLLILLFFAWVLYGMYKIIKDL